ncbi:MAG: DUF4258 domain-containing protein [Methylococcaceae bacterium]|jgi:hypothetical protein
MNLLKIYTLATHEPDTFLVYWTNSTLRPKGLLRVRITAQVDDRNIVAELAAMQHLLEDKGVIGNSVIGNPNVKLVVSLGAIRKLHRMQSDKAHLAPYANFLTTRFADCPITADKDTRWFNGYPLESAENLLVSAPRAETLLVAGFGAVGITNHVLERIAERFLSEAERSAQAAWKMLRDVVADTSVREVARNSAITTAKYAQEGRYFLNARRNLVLVVTNKPGEGKKLVTAYPPDNKFHELARAA